MHRIHLTVQVYFLPLSLNLLVVYRTTTQSDSELLYDIETTECNIL